MNSQATLSDFTLERILSAVKSVAAAKNVIGIAAGMLDGLNYTSLKGALMVKRHTRDCKTH